MDALKFMSEWGRMCDSIDVCPNCTLYNIECGVRPDCYCAEELEDIVNRVEKWSNDNPRKSRMTVFFSHYPTAVRRGTDGYPDIDPCKMDETYKKKRDDGCSGMCSKCRKDYWGEWVE